GGGGAGGWGPTRRTSHGGRAERLAVIDEPPARPRLPRPGARSRRRASGYPFRRGLTHGGPPPPDRHVRALPGERPVLGFLPESPRADTASFGLGGWDAKTRARASSGRWTRKACRPRGQAPASSHQPKPV